jgi:hypothetical protein
MFYQNVQRIYIGTRRRRLNGERYAPSGYGWGEKGWETPAPDLRMQIRQVSVRLSVHTRLMPAWLL